jgi:hypothetical protein
MIWRCAGCGAGFSSMHLYEVHANVCIPLHLGDSYRNIRKITTEGRHRLAGVKVGGKPEEQPHYYDPRRERKGERGRPKGSPVAPSTIVP